MIDPQMAEDTAEGGDLIPREAPEIAQRRKALVSSMTKMVKSAKEHWKDVFKQMRDDQRFCAGSQWPGETKSGYFNDAPDDRYVANITLRHVQQRVASLYAKNPKAIARRRKRLYSTVWDGQMQSLMQAQKTIKDAETAQQAMQAMQMGLPPLMDPATGQPAMPPEPPDPVAIQNAQDVISEAQRAKAEIDQVKKIADTLELLYEYEVDEQTMPFKTMMKMVVRRACTAGVGWVKVGFQRVMGRSPDYDTRLTDLETRLAQIERISADIADGEMQEDSAEAEQLRLMIEDIRREPEVVLREGLQFSYPKPTAIIVDPRCVALREFVGSDWVAEEYCLSINEIKETYGIDVSKSYQAYDRDDVGKDYESARALFERGKSSDEDAEKGDGESALVWEVYNKKTGLVYVVCDGYPDFLREPAAPDPWITRFWPWFPIMFNETEGEVYPPSDVKLVRHMQLELNRSRQGMREHRWASRPKTAYAEGLLSADDIEALRTHPVNALIALSGLQPGQSVNDVLQPIAGYPFNPAIYEVNPVFQDLMRAVGDQEANLGGTTDATATQTQVAQQSRSSAIGSAVDDIDDTLSALARASGEILLLNVSEDTVKEVVGPGAVWPTLTKAAVAKNIYLEVEAGSSGRPDQQLAVMNFERLAPILMQLPGVTPTFLAREAIKRLDDKLDVDEAFAEGVPSIMAQNGAKGDAGGGVGPAPAAQGPQGANNAPRPPQPKPEAPGVKSTQPMGAPAPVG